MNRDGLPKISNKAALFYAQNIDKALDIYNYKSRNNVSAEDVFINAFYSRIARGYDDRPEFMHDKAFFNRAVNSALYAAIEYSSADKREGERYAKYIVEDLDDEDIHGGATPGCEDLFDIDGRRLLEKLFRDFKTEDERKAVYLLSQGYSKTEICEAVPGAKYIFLTIQNRYIEIMHDADMFLNKRSPYESGNTWRRKARAENKNGYRDKEIEYREENADRIKENKKQWNLDNKEKVKADNRKYHKDNKKKLNAKSRKYYEDNKDDISKKRKTPEAREYHREYMRARRAAAAATR